MLLLLSNTATLSEFFVATNGSDSNPGTFLLPFKTPGRAATAVRGVRGTMTEDVVVNLRGGTYSIPATQSLSQDDSGMHGYNVVYQSYPGETATISGANTVTGWTSNGDGTYTAATSLNFRQMYVNGVRAIRARTTSFTVTNWNTSAKTISIPSSAITTWERLTEVELVITHHWNQCNLRVASFEVAGATTHITPMAPERDQFFGNGISPQGGLGYFENALEHLNADGEWYLNTVDDEVTYRPRTGENMATAVVTVPQIETLLRLEGTLNNPIHHVKFYGLEFADSTWMNPTNVGYVSSQGPKIWPDNSMPVAVEVKNAHDITFERNTFRRMGASAFGFWSGVDDSTFIGNYVTDTSGNGVCVDLQLTANPADSRTICHDDTISNNYIENCGVQYTGAVAVFLGYTDTAHVLHNEITNIPWTGIHVGWGHTLNQTALLNNQVRYNRIWEVMTQRADGAGIYSLSRQDGTLISDNYVFDVERGPLATGNGTCAGLYLDEGSDYITVDQNVLENVDEELHDNTDGTHNTVDLTPSGPDAIKAAAGIEEDYQDIRPSMLSLPKKNGRVRRWLRRAYLRMGQI